MLLVWHSAIVFNCILSLSQPERNEVLHVSRYSSVVLTIRSGRCAARRRPLHLPHSWCGHRHCLLGKFSARGASNSVLGLVVFVVPQKRAMLLIAACSCECHIQVPYPVLATMCAVEVLVCACLSLIHRTIWCLGLTQRADRIVQQAVVALHALVAALFPANAVLLLEQCGITLVPLTHVATD